MHSNYKQEPFGRRAKIGIIIPTENTITEPEFNMMKPSGVTVHFTRMPIHFNPEKDNFKSLLVDLKIRLIELKTCGVNAVAYNCTVGSMACPNELLINRLEEVSGVNAVSTASSIIKALNELNITRIALATPYTSTTNEHEKTFLNKYGIEVVRMIGMDFEEKGAALGRRFGQISPKEIYNHAITVDHKDAEAILISCANFGSAQIIGELEEKLRKPVVSSNTVTFWASLRAAKIKDSIRGFGELLSEN